MYFVAIGTDYTTRQTGLSSFTVYRSRNGGSATAYTTPTISELSAANMPGVYALLIDEDTTLDAGQDQQEYTVHITQASMIPVTRAIEIYRPKGTEGETLTVSSGVGTADVTKLGGSAQSLTDLKDFADDGYDPATNKVQGVVLVDTTTTNTDMISAANVRSAVGLASANLDTQLETIDNFLDTEVAAIKAKTDNLPAAPAATGDCITAAGVRSAVGLASANLDTQLSSLFTTAMAESYSADGSPPTPAQALMMILQRLTEFSISGTSITVKKLDGSTTAFVLTMNDATSPTSSTRAS